MSKQKIMKVVLAYAFDPARSAVLLIAGQKSGISSDLFYRCLIRVADRRFGLHLDALSGSGP